MRDRLQLTDRLNDLVGSLLRTARVPGAGIAVVAGGEIIHAGGYGYRNLQGRLPLTSQTVYPIGSTTKAFNATLLGILVDEGKLAWDAPVQNYLPEFRLQDPLISAHVTLRDLLVMRTGLPRHDWLWIENPMSRAELTRRLRFLQPSAGLRERFQYNNLTVTAAAYIAEVVTGRNWEELLQTRIFEPLGMADSGFVRPGDDRVTTSYIENDRRELIVSPCFRTDAAGPAGGSIYSTSLDMARWMMFNLTGHKGAALLRPQTLKEIHTPQIVMGADASARKPNASYAIGWTVDTYNGCTRLSHGGYVHAVNSEVVLFPRDDVGIVSFVNFGPPMLALLLAEHTFDLITGRSSVHTLEDKLAQYEIAIADTREGHGARRRVANTSPSHLLTDYSGVYVSAGYGALEIREDKEELTFHRNRLIVPLEHWHYDVWVFRHCDLFAIHQPHAFDRSSCLQFEADADGEVTTVSLRLEPAVAPIRFTKHE